MEEGIPKKIHYCWFGGNPLPPLAQKCIASWKKYCPDYEIIEWNESNYDMNKNKYMQEAYAAKKWGFVPDYARLDIIYQHGGIYLDTDVELLKPPDAFLCHKLYIGLERAGVVNLGLGFGAEKENPIIYQMREAYEALSFIREDGTLNLVASPTYQTEFLKAFGLSNQDALQEIADGCYIYPTRFFNPCDLDTGRIVKTKDTVSIHHYSGSWLSMSNKINVFIYQKINRLFGKKSADKLRNVKRKLWPR